MAMFINNRLTHDTNEQHLQRCERCVIGIAMHNAELNFKPDWITDLDTHILRFKNFTNLQNLHDAEWHSKIVDQNMTKIALTENNSRARWMIKTIIDDDKLSPGTRKLIADAFDIDEKVGNSFFSLTQNTRKILNGQEKLISMGITWRLPQNLIDALTTNLSLLQQLASSSEIEHGEKLKATIDVKGERSIGERILRNIFRWIIANWGDGDTRLLDFGFVPKSQIRTPSDDNKLPAPRNFSYDKEKLFLKWDTVDGADKYVVEHKIASEQYYTKIGTVLTNEFKLKTPYIGDNFFRVTAVRDEDLGEPSAPLDVKISYLGEITNFRWDESDQYLKWDVVPGATCYLVLANDEPFGDLVLTNQLHVVPDPERDLRMQVWASNGVGATPRSAVVIVPKA